VPSHVGPKLAGNDEELKRSVKDQLKYFQNRFGNFEKIINGNEIVDELTKEIQDFGLTGILEGTPIFTFKINNEIYEGKLRSLMKEYFSTTYAEIKQKASKKEFNVWHKISQENSNELWMQKGHIWSDIQDFLFKLSINKLFLQGEQWKQTKTEWNSFYDFKKYVEYPTFRCETCKSDYLDAYHLLYCS